MRMLTRRSLAGDAVLPTGSVVLTRSRCSLEEVVIQRRYWLHRLLVKSNLRHVAVLAGEHQFALLLRLPSCWRPTASHLLLAAVLFELFDSVAVS